MAERELAAVYLLWAPLGTEVVARFARSYRALEAGVDHRLVVVANGFDGAGDARLAEALRALEQEDVAHETIVLESAVFDLAAYRIAAERLAPARCCFLNSYSTILAPGWLARLNDGLEAPGTGLVGASGSWGSMRSYVRFQFGLGGAYARVFSDRRETNRILAAIDRRNARADAPRAGFVAGKLKTARATVEQTRGFAPFPAPHVRSTGFMVDSELLAQLRFGSLESKIATYRLESGAHSLTAQVRSLGLRTLVVDRDGRHHEVDGWPASATFWQSRQQGLLIADKQTAHYDEVDPAGRRVLSGFAWGDAGDAAERASG